MIGAEISVLIGNFGLSSTKLKTFNVPKVPPRSLSKNRRPELPQVKALISAADLVV